MIRLIKFEGVLLALGLLFLAGCAKHYYFEGTVVEVSETSMLITVDDPGDTIDGIDVGDLLMVHIGPDSEAEQFAEVAGKRIHVVFDGNIEQSYPGQITYLSIAIIDN